MSKAEKTLQKRGAVYQCSSCVYRGNKAQTTKHVVSYHLAEEKVPFICGICLKRSLKREEMVKHIREKHVGCDVDEWIQGTLKTHTLTNSEATPLPNHESVSHYQARVSSAPVKPSPKTGAVKVRSVVTVVPPTEPTKRVNLPPPEPVLTTLMLETCATDPPPSTGEPVSVPGLEGHSMQALLGTLQDNPEILKQICAAMELRSAVDSITTSTPVVETSQAEESRAYLEPDPSFHADDNVENTIRVVVASSPCDEVLSGLTSPGVGEVEADVGEQSDGNDEEHAVEIHIPENDGGGHVTIHPDPAELEEFDETSRVELPEMVNSVPKVSEQPHLAGSIPLTAVAEMIEPIVRNTVDSIASAIIIAARKQPLPPEQDLRPVTSQLMTTNLNMGNIVAQLDKLFHLHGQLMDVMKENVNAVSGLRSEVSRVNRAITSLATDIADLRSGLKFQTNALQTIIQGSIDAQGTLTQAMDRQSENLNKALSRMSGLVENKRRDGQVTEIVNKILNLKAKSQTTSTQTAQGNSSGESEVSKRTDTSGGGRRNSAVSTSAPTEGWRIPRHSARGGRHFNRGSHHQSNRGRRNPRYQPYERVSPDRGLAATMAKIKRDFNQKLKKKEQ